MDNDPATFVRIPRAGPMADLSDRFDPTMSSELERESPHDTRLNNISREVDRLHDVIGALEDRLTPVLLAGRPTEKVEEKTPVGESALSCNLISLACDFAGVRRRLMNLVERIDL